MNHGARILPALLAMALLVACGGKEPGKKPTIAQEAERISQFFNTPAPFTERQLDTADVDHFLAGHPQYRPDSADMHGFYAGRGYQYAWFTRDSLSFTADVMLNLLDPLGTDEKVDAWRKLVTVARGAPQLGDSLRKAVELGLTAEYFHLAKKQYGGYVQGDLRELGWYIPRNKKNYAGLLDSLVAGSTDLSPIEPVHPQYQGLKYWLQRYYGVDTLEQAPRFGFSGKAVAMGDSLPVLCDLRHRLFLLGDLHSDSITDVMDSTLFKGIRNFQQRHGLKDTGVPDAAMAEALNTPLQQRIGTLLLNMERLRWVNPSPPKDHLLVNIPEYRLHVFEQGRETWSMKVVVGAVATHTVIFSGEVSLIAFAPYWNVPQSILRNEIVPAMRRDPGYLARQDMELLRGNTVVPAGAVDWKTFQGGGGYSVRQRPGPKNSLGQVKFLFPNEYSIYLHDTPAQSRFGQEKRAFSHGCIRLSEPVRLAEYLLRNDSTWDATAIAKAMQGRTERMVKVVPPMPVTIGYFTAWVDSDGRLNFRDDVYGHDARLARELFAPETLPRMAPEAAQAGATASTKR